MWFFLFKHIANVAVDAQFFPAKAFASLEMNTITLLTRFAVQLGSAFSATAILLRSQSSQTGWKTMQEKTVCVLTRAALTAHAQEICRSSSRLWKIKCLRQIFIWTCCKPTFWTMSSHNFRMFPNHLVSKTTSAQIPYYQSIDICIFGQFQIFLILLMPKNMQKCNL